ncbi:MAG: hypothetical protein CVV64_00075 [Candidatus Wallbacteria bacterium HGW-Wallbacteria-1]|jgi:hypothetical protein|uniref:Uncharacterized protein n=1 Tax=Candidatus Wallbacteria bacterium HGW-Wallbacteria-1 TaxID=2013854 RepID=A0A2N1PU54_9BACT|nr:MAG: hypothetical protein CVV64_00075 [Candidatus Wallbacteria bacterium HGW-Wallbacteria-1]
MNREVSDRICRFYIDNARLIGFFYCVLPSLIAYGYGFVSVPFRQIYLVRLALTVILGGSIGAIANRMGVELWICKYRSELSATVLDGMIIGGVAGSATAMVPAISLLIDSNHIEDAKWLVILSWPLFFLVGAIIGGVIARYAILRLDR